MHVVFDLSLYESLGQKLQTLTQSIAFCLLSCSLRISSFGLQRSRTRVKKLMILVWSTNLRISWLPVTEGFVSAEEEWGPTDSDGFGSDIDFFSETLWSLWFPSISDFRDREVEFDTSSRKAATTDIRYSPSPPTPALGKLSPLPFVDGTASPSPSPSSPRLTSSLGNANTPNVRSKKAERVRRTDVRRSRSSNASGKPVLFYFTRSFLV